MKAKRVIFDTNLWVSFLISNKLSEFDRLIYKQKIKLVFSKELIDEFLEVVSRSKFLKYFSNSDIQKVLTLFDEYGVIVQITSNINICRDPNDNFLLNLAVDGNANFLLTGDTDLLVIGHIGKTKILTVKEFLKDLE